MTPDEIKAEIITAFSTVPMGQRPDQYVRDCLERFAEIAAKILAEK